MSNSTECEVCCSSFNNSTRKLVVCIACPYNACRSCHSQYLLSDPNDPHCLNCKKAWNREFLLKYFSKSFVDKEYKQHREEVLFSREKSLLPDTIRFAEREKLYEDLKKDLPPELQEVNKKIRELNRTCCDYQTGTAEKMELLDKLSDLTLKATALQAPWSLYAAKKKALKKAEADARYDRENNPNDKKEEEVEKRQFIKACPSDGCNGMLSTQWKCGLCYVKVCSKCLEIKETVGEDEKEEKNEHVCHPDSVATAEMIKRDTKPCPKCGACIHKINGCDQMYCVQCHTPFSWETGREVTGRIHNPHYFEYLRATGTNRREVGDIPCGGIPYVPDNHPIVIMLDELVRLDNHVEDVEMHKTQINEVTYNRTIRVKYLLQKIDEKQFKRLIYKNAKLRDFKMEMHMLWDMFRNITAELVRRAILVTKDPELSQIQDEIIAFIVYIKRTLNQIHCRYGYVNRIHYFSYNFSEASSSPVIKASIKFVNIDKQFPRKAGKGLKRNDEWVYSINQSCICSAWKEGRQIPLTIDDLKKIIDDFNLDPH